MVQNTSQPTVSCRVKQRIWESQYLQAAQEKTANYPSAADKEAKKADRQAHRTVDILIDEAIHKERDRGDECEWDKSRTQAILGIPNTFASFTPLDDSAVGNTANNLSSYCSILLVSAHEKRRTTKR